MYRGLFKHVQIRLQRICVFVNSQELPQTTTNSTGLNQNERDIRSVGSNVRYPILSRRQLPFENVCDVNVRADDRGALADDNGERRRESKWPTGRRSTLSNIPCVIFNRATAAVCDWCVVWTLIGARRRHFSACDSGSQRASRLEIFKGVEMSSVCRRPLRLVDSETTSAVTKGMSGHFRAFQRVLPSYLHLGSGPEVVQNAPFDVGVMELEGNCPASSCSLSRPIPAVVVLLCWKFRSGSLRLAAKCIYTTVFPPSLLFFFCMMHIVMDGGVALAHADERRTAP